MTKEDFINWLGRPITESDSKMIDLLLEMLDLYDKNIILIEELNLKISKLQKEKIKDLSEQIEILEA